MRNPHRPDIVLVVFDALHEADVSSATPHLDDLRRGSAQFSRTYAPCPDSSPARASLFTGLDPCVHGLWADGVTLPARERVFPQLLTQAGYVTWLAGRRHLAGVATWTTEHCRPDEYAVFDWAHGPLHRSRQNAYLAWLQASAPERYAAIFPAQPDPDATGTPPGQREAVANLPDASSFNHWVGACLAERIAARPSDRPFLAVAGFVVGANMGAEPLSRRLGEPLDRRALQQADAAVGHILSECGEDTVVIVTAARGTEAAGGGAGAMREQAIRVPLFIRATTCGADVVDAPVSTMDIAPTILDLAGVPRPARMQGVSLLDILNRGRAPRGWAMSRSRAPGAPRCTAFRDGRYKLVVCHGDPSRDVTPTYRLYDLEADPGEGTDLAGGIAYGETLEDMIDRMIDARCALEDRTEPRIASF